MAGLFDTVEAVPQADGHPRRARHLGWLGHRLATAVEADVRDRSRTSTGELNWNASATVVKSRSGLHQAISVVGQRQVLCDDAAGRAAVRGRRSATGKLVVRYLGWGRAAGRLKQAHGDWAAYLTSLRRPRTFVDYSFEAMNITSQRRINATLIGAHFASFASYLPKPKAIDGYAFRGGR